MRFTSAREAMDKNLSGPSKALLTLIEPTIDYTVRCLFKDLKQVSVDFCSYSASLLTHWDGWIEYGVILMGCFLLENTCFLISFIEFGMEFCEHYRGGLGGWDEYAMTGHEILSFDFAIVNELYICY